jgi:hypothetical protein
MSFFAAVPAKGSTATPSSAKVLDDSARAMA